MHDYIKIQLRRIPGKYPAASYVDIKYVPDRIVKIGQYVEKVVTSKKFKTVTDINYLNRMVQSQHYNRYELTIFADETLDIRDLDLAETVNITDKNGTVHVARIIEFQEPEKIENTQHLIYRLQYYDINTANYKDNGAPVSSYLERTALLEDFTAAQLWAFTFISSRTIDSTFTALGDTYTVYTKLELEETSETQPVYADDKNRDLLAQGVLFRKYTGRFYLNEYDKNLVEKYAKLCNRLRFTKGATTYNSVSELQIEVNENEVFVDLYEVNITLIIQKLSSNYLESDTIQPIANPSDLKQLNVIYNSASYKFYTIIDPLFDIEKPVTSDATRPDGIKLISKQVVQQSVNIEFYLNEENKNTMKRYIEVASSVVFTYDSTNYTAVEPCEATIEAVENAIDLYRCNVKLKYSNSDIYPLKT